MLPSQTCIVVYYERLIDGEWIKNLSTVYYETDNPDIALYIFASDHKEEIQNSTVKAIKWCYYSPGPMI